MYVFHNTAAGVLTLTHQRKVLFRETLNLMTAAATAWGDAEYVTLRAGRSNFVMI